MHEAFASLQEKLYDDSTEEERLEAFKKHFQDFTKKRYDIYTQMIDAVAEKTTCS